MTITIVAAVSIDGKLTRHDENDVTQWTSAEDKTHFRSMINDNDVLIMGRGTYEAVQQKPDVNTLRVVLTTHPGDYQDKTVEGQLEFYNAAPSEIIDQIQGRGYKTALIVGGTGTISPFLASGIVDYLFLTIEPYIFGDGKPLATGQLNSSFVLQEMTKLNDRGSLLLKYKRV